MSRPTYQGRHQGRTTMSNKQLGVDAGRVGEDRPGTAELIAAGVPREQRRQGSVSALQAAAMHAAPADQAAVGSPITTGKRVLLAVITTAIVAVGVVGTVLTGAAAPVVAVMCILAGFAAAAGVALRPHRFARVAKVAPWVLGTVGVGGFITDLGNGSTGWAVLAVTSGVAAAVIVRTAATTFSPAEPLPAAVLAAVRAAGAQVVDLGAGHGSLAIFANGRSAVIGSADGGEDLSRDAQLAAFVARMKRIRATPGGADLEGICVLAAAGQPAAKVADGVWVCSGSNLRRTAERLRHP